MKHTESQYQAMKHFAKEIQHIESLPVNDNEKDLATEEKIEEYLPLIVG
ncbi:MAG: hypothetical protein KDC74_10075 [Flavobacteriaceae bacterium]|nr:hypothetical protein [Flavobacteriaceae bacterium]